MDDVYKQCLIAIASHGCSGEHEDDICINTDLFLDDYCHPCQAQVALNKSTAQLNWQPFETAPKGRPFLAYQHIVEDPQDMDNYWIAEWFEGELECGAPNPTDWTPLPAPPVADVSAPQGGGTASDNPTP